MDLKFEFIRPVLLCSQGATSPSFTVLLIKHNELPKVAVEFETNVEDLDSEAGSDF